MRQLAICALLAACATVVPEDVKSGKDARPKGARNIVIEDGAGSARDVVTWPGGDRVDWKKFELKDPHDVTVTLRWTSPRKGLDLSMNVLDKRYHVLETARPSPTGTRRTMKSVTLERLPPGEYYVQVYASRRGDAGEYALDVELGPAGPAPDGDKGDDIPNPPVLARVPTVKQGCDPAVSKCPDTEKKACPAGELVPGADCQATKANCVTGRPPPEGVTCDPLACKGKEVWDPATTSCVKPIILKTVEGDVSDYRTPSRTEVIIRINKGSKAGVEVGWTGDILDKDGDPRPGFSFTVYEVSARESLARFDRVIKRSQLGKTDHVILREPPPSE